MITLLCVYCKSSAVSFTRPSGLCNDCRTTINADILVSLVTKARPGLSAKKVIEFILRDLKL